MPIRNDEPVTPDFSALSYDECLDALHELTDRIEELTEEQEDFADDELAIRLATINNLDAVLILHGIQREDAIAEDEDESDDEDDEELEVEEDVEE